MQTIAPIRQLCALKQAEQARLRSAMDSPAYVHNSMPQLHCNLELPCLRPYPCAVQFEVGDEVFALTDTFAKHKEGEAVGCCLE